MNRHRCSPGQRKASIVQAHTWSLWDEGNGSSNCAEAMNVPKKHKTLDVLRRCRKLANEMNIGKRAARTGGRSLDGTGCLNSLYASVCVGACASRSLATCLNESRISDVLAREMRLDVPALENCRPGSRSHVIWHQCPPILAGSAREKTIQQRGVPGSPGRWTGRRCCATSPLA